MPRGRFLSKSISLDEKVNALSDDTARLLFTWLISHLDCEGRLHGDPTTVKSIVFPRRKISVRRVEKYLEEIAKLGLILRYSVNGNAYLFAPHFEKHQMGLQKGKEAQSQIPPFTPELLHSKARISPLQAKGKEKFKFKIKSKDIHSILFYLWNEQEIFVHKKLTDDMKWAIDGASKEHSEEEISQAIKNYAEILKGEQYYFKYIWTLKDFLKRGLEKFLDLKIAQQNYLKDKGEQGGAHQQSSRRLIPRDQYTRPEDH